MIFYATTAEAEMSSVVILDQTSLGGEAAARDRPRRSREGELCRRLSAGNAREEGIALKQQSVVFRAEHYDGQLAIKLTRRNISFVTFGGLTFLDSAHVKSFDAPRRGPLRTRLLNVENQKADLAKIQR